MKVALMTDFDSPDVMRHGDSSDPKLSGNDVLIKVIRAGMNPIDHYLRNGDFGAIVPLPHILGSDAAGEVVAVGADVTAFKVGDRVIPMPGYPLNSRDHAFSPLSAAPSYGIVGVGRHGTHAQYLSVPAEWVVPDSTGLAPELIATLPMVVVTTVRAVRVVGEVKAGDRVLVLAGASGTGSMAIQVAKALGAQVAAIVRGEDRADFVRSLGAELVIDTTKTTVHPLVQERTDGRGADVVIDNLGGDLTRQS
ncbi:MAG: zinc-binding alcohol dehydrogenase family protein [Oscillatoriales cyanobacterium SM2_2_1]|nr:zinc-binding alcohol dehydrogenase family protein [Oscillatoriales cyanobacterium SM2_2_1]